MEFTGKEGRCSCAPETGTAGCRGLLGGRETHTFKEMESAPEANSQRGLEGTGQVSGTQLTMALRATVLAQV